MMGLSGCTALESGITLPLISTACGGLVPSRRASAVNFECDSDEQALYRTVATNKNITIKIAIDLDFILRVLSVPIQTDVKDEVRRGVSL
jgi:hypothetical protein